MLAETSSKVLSFSGLIHGICMSFNWNRMCVSFQYNFLKERLKTKLSVILLVLCRGRARVTRPVPAVCHFCATLIFQEIKETAKDKQSYVNTTLAFALPPRKIQKGAKHIKGDNGLLATTYTSTCQEHSKLSSRLSIAASRDQLLNQEQPKWFSDSLMLTSKSICSISKRGEKSVVWKHYRVLWSSPNLPRQFKNHQ